MKEIAKKLSDYYENLKSLYEEYDADHDDRPRGDTVTSGGSGITSNTNGDNPPRRKTTIYDEVEEDIESSRPNYNYVDVGGKKKYQSPFAKSIAYTEVAPSRKKKDEDEEAWGTNRKSSAPAGKSKGYQGGMDYSSSTSSLMSPLLESRGDDEGAPASNNPFYVETDDI